MHTPTTRKQEIIRTIIVFTIMPLAVISIVSLLAFYMLGYRIDFSERSIEQGGLLQVSTRPNGASVSIDGERRFTSPGRADLSSGSHTLKFTKEGYRPWVKKITINPGEVRWENYIRLLPEAIDEEVVQKYKTVSSTAVSSGGNRIAIIKDQTKPSITVEDITKQETTTRDVVIPETVYTKNENKDSKHSFHTPTWAPRGDRFILLLHSFENGSEWLYVDTIEPEKSKNLSTIAGMKINDIQFLRSEDNAFLVLTKADVRILDANNDTLSAPKIRNVQRFKYGYDGYVTYATVPDYDKKIQKLGYWSHRSNTNKIVETIALSEAYDSNELPVAMLYIGKYEDTYYMVTQNKRQVSVDRVRLSDDEDGQIEKTNLYMTKTEGTPSYIGFSPSGRFVSIVYDTVLKNYDIELDELHELTVEQPTLAVQSQVQDMAFSEKDYKIHWIDDFMFRSDRKGMLRFSEYDGQNANDIVRYDNKKSVTISRNNEFLYYFAQDKDGAIELRRIRLLL